MAVKYRHERQCPRLRHDQRATQLKSADRAVVLVLDPCFDTRLLAGGKALVDKRPRILGRGRHMSIDNGLCFVNLRERWELHESSIRFEGLRLKVEVGPSRFTVTML